MPSMLEIHTSPLSKGDVKAKPREDATSQKSDKPEFSALMNQAEQSPEQDPGNAGPQEADGLNLAPGTVNIEPEAPGHSGDQADAAIAAEEILAAPAGAVEGEPELESETDAEGPEANIAALSAPTANVTPETPEPGGEAEVDSIDPDAVAAESDTPKQETPAETESKTPRAAAEPVKDTGTVVEKDAIADTPANIAFEQDAQQTSRSQTAPADPAAAKTGTINDQRPAVQDASSQPAEPITAAIATEEKQTQGSASAGKVSQTTEQNVINPVAQASGETPLLDRTPDAAARPDPSDDFFKVSGSALPVAEARVEVPSGSLTASTREATFMLPAAAGATSPIASGPFGTVQAAAPPVMNPANLLAVPPTDIPNILTQALSSGEDGQDRLVVQLDPPELGRVSLDFKFDAQGLQGITITGESPEALRRIRMMHSELVQALEQHGLPGENLTFSHQQSGQHQQQQIRFSETGLVPNADSQMAWSVTPPTRGPATLTAEGLDIRV